MSNNVVLYSAQRELKQNKCQQRKETRRSEIKGNHLLKPEMMHKIVLDLFEHLPPIMSQCEMEDGIYVSHSLYVNISQYLGANLVVFGEASEGTFSQINGDQCMVCGNAHTDVKQMCKECFLGNSYTSYSKIYVRSKNS